jgi:hypothetical protein
MKGRCKGSAREQKVSLISYVWTRPST